MRISDWSSDVCSSDLVRADPGRNDIALKYRVALIEIAAGAVGSLHAGNAVQKADLAYRRPEGGVASLCKPGRNCGAGQGLDGFRRQARAIRGCQWGRRDLADVVAEDRKSTRLNAR